jgi:hypothetical protein
VAEDFFLRFGAIVSTVRINQAAVKSASNALKAALSTNAEINVDVGFKQTDAKLVIDQIKKIQKEASSIFGKSAIAGGSGTPKNITDLVKSVESVRAASISAAEALKLININPASFKGADNIKIELLKLQQSLRVLKREGEAKIKINFDESALEGLLNKTQRLKSNLQSRQNVLGTTIGQFIKARSSQEEQKEKLTPGYNAKSRTDIRDEALSLFNPSSAKDLTGVNNLINVARKKTQEVTSAVFDQARAVQQVSKEEKIRIANAERLFAVEQQIQKTIEKEVAAESARAKLSATRAVSFTPRSRVEIESSVRSTPEVAGVLSSSNVSRLQKLQAGAKLRAESDASIKAEKQSLKELNNLETARQKTPSRQNVLGATIGQFIKARSSQEEQKEKLTPGYKAKSRTEIRDEALSLFNPSSAKDLASVNNVINEVRRKTQEVTASVFDQTKAVQQLSKEEKIRVANAERLFAIEQQIQKTIEKELAAESARSKLAASRGVSFTPRSRVEIEASVRSNPEVAGALSSSNVSRLQTMQAGAALRAEADASIKAEKQALKELNNLETARQKTLDQEEKKRDKIKKNVQDIYNTLAKINALAAQSGGTYTPLTKRQLAQRAVEVAGLSDTGSGPVNISALSGGKLDAALGSTKKKTQEAKEAMSEFKDMLRGVEKGTVSPLQFISKFGNSFERLGAQVTLATQRIVGYVVGASAVFGVISFIKQSTDEFFKLEAQLVKVAQTLDRTADAKSRVGQLSDFVKVTGENLGLKPDKVASGISLLAQAGYTDVGQLQEAITAISQAELGPSFGNQEQIVDGLIATYRQFNLTLADTRTILDVVNQFSKEYAVESKDIFEIIKRGGSAFSVLGGSFEGFVKIASSLRQETRESAATIGTSLKTITTSLYRPKFEKYLNKLDPKILQELDPEQRLRAVAAAFAKIQSPQEKIDFISQLIDTRNSGKVFALFNALNREAASLDETASRAAGSVLRDAIIKLNSVGSALDRAKIALENASINLLDNPFAIQLIKTVSGAGSVAGKVLSLKPVSTVAAPAIAGVAIYALANIIKSSIFTYKSLINSNSTLALNLEKLNASMSILNTSITGMSARGSAAAAGAASAAGAGAGGAGAGGATGFFGKTKAFFGTNLGQGIAAFVGSSILDQVAATVQDSSPTTASALKVGSGGLQGFALSRAIGLGTKGTVAGTLVGAGLEAYGQYAQYQQIEKIKQEQQKQQLFSRRSLETQKFISSGVAPENFQASFGPQIERFFIDKDRPDKRLQLLLDTVIDPQGTKSEVQSKLSKFIKQSTPGGTSLTESDVADIVTSLTESGGQGTQLKETLRKLYKNAAFRAQEDGLTGGERDEAIKKELGISFKREGVNYTVGAFDKIFASLKKTIGDTTGFLINFEEAMMNFKASLDLANAAIVSSIKLSADRFDRGRELRASQLLGAEQLQNIFDPQRFTPGEGAALSPNTTARDLSQFGFGAINDPRLNNRIKLIDDFVTAFRASPESSANLSSFSKIKLKGIEGQATEDNISSRTDFSSDIEDIDGIRLRIESTFGFMKDMAPELFKEILKNPFAFDFEEFGKLAQSAETNVGEKMLGRDKLKVAQTELLNSLIRDQNDALKQSNALSELNFQKRSQIKDIELQIAKTRYEGNSQAIDIRQGAGMISATGAASERAAQSDKLVRTIFSLGGNRAASGSSNLSSGLVDVQKNMVELFGNIQRNSYVMGNNKDDLLKFADKINSIISSNSLTTGPVDTKQQNSQKLLADTVRAYNEAKSEIPKLVDIFLLGIDAMKQGVITTVQDLQSKIQAGTGFIKESFAQMFGGGAEQGYTAQFEAQKARDNIREVVSELQTKGITPQYLDNTKNLVQDPGLQVFAEDLVTRLFGSGDLSGIMDSAKKAGQNQFENSGFTGEQIYNLLAIAGGMRSVKENTGFGIDLGSAFGGLDANITILGNLINSQISAQKDNIGVIQNQTSLISDSTTALAKALEGIPDTIKVQIGGVETINLNLTKTNAEEDMKAIKTAVTEQVMEYIRRALETSGITINSMGAPGR